MGKTRGGKFNLRESSEPLRRDRDPLPDHDPATGRVQLWFRLRLRLPERWFLQLRRKLRLTLGRRPAATGLPPPTSGLPLPLGAAPPT